ncbi:hypothetical protein Pcinc_025166 [Petrolisthes cinctipes]|uniref:Uncharacterized protein n=1 Tax=Petrolisthes cinctipes TaxID=88211 RepID=A0AAE1K9U1_PETCI|nr:hypothetical protein Pcinc_025166 [Petrolisthes cinctipes]
MASDNKDLAGEGKGEDREDVFASHDDIRVDQSPNPHQLRVSHQITLSRGVEVHAFMNIVFFLSDEAIVTLCSWFG